MSHGLRYGETSQSLSSEESTIAKGLKLRGQTDTKMWEVDVKMRDEREMGKVIEKEKMG